MRRRIFVATVASAASITGCLDDEMPDGNETDERDEDNGREGEDAAEDVAVADTEFEVLEGGGGTRGDEVSVVFDEDRTVTVEGELVGRNSCYTAVLESSEYDADEDVLRASVLTDDGTDEDVFCADVMTEIRYRLVVSFEGGLPETVAVSHDGEVVAEAIRD